MMKIKAGYLLREVAGIAVVVPIMADAANQNMLKLNETGKLLWEKLIPGAEKAELLSALMAEYEVTAERAEADVAAFLGQLSAFGALED